jgi:excisionase family DNA binding protein
MIPKKLLSFKEAAEIMTISVVTVKRLASKKILPTVHFSRRSVRIPFDGLMAFLEAGGIDINAEAKGA